MTNGIDLSLEPWDLSPVTNYLTSRTEQAAEAAWVGALVSLSRGFPTTIWGADHTVSKFGAGAHTNLYNQEIPRGFKVWLTGQGVTVDDYADHVGPLQYLSAEIRLLSLLPHAASNKGWRVRIVGFPALRLVAFGLSSHYQGTQNQNEMGRASSLIRSRALEVVSGEEKHALEGWPSATSADWDNRGLMVKPVLSLGDLDISTYDGGAGAMLRMVRNTTVKKELSTFFGIKGMAADDFLVEGGESLLTLRQIALTLGGTEAQ